MTIQEYVIAHTERGECKCGQCIDRGDKPDPAGHTADLIFFKVAGCGERQPERRRVQEARGGASFDGSEHGYMELGGWIGDQGLAMQYMGLGTLLGLFTLLTPRSMGMPPDLVMVMAGLGLVTIMAKPTNG